MAVAVLAGPVAGDTAGPINGWNGSTFVDVKTPPLGENELWDTQWAMHVSYAFTNYAGFLFELQYDGHEMNQITMTPVGSHTGLEVPAEFGLKTSWVFPGSQPGMQTVPWVAAWINPDLAMGSGITVSQSQLIPVFNISGQAKNTSLINNSDIDITLNAWQILHLVNTGTYQIGASDWLYLTQHGNDFESNPGNGRWFHQTATQTIQIPASFFVATNAFIQNVAGFGIEHIPVPGAWALIGSGLGIGALARRRRRA
jgi:hypothetical protein